MDDVGAAVRFPQPIVERAGIEEQKPARPSGVGGLQQRIRRQIGDNERYAAVGEPRNGGRRIVAFLQFHVFEREMLIRRICPWCYCR